MNPTIFFQIIGGIGSLGILALGIGYLWSQFIRGKKSGSKENIDAENTLVTYLKNQVEGFAKIVKEQDIKFVALGKEIAALKATIDEKDKTIEKYLGILQNRNPELDTFIKESRIRQEHTLEIMTQIKDCMVNINTHMQKHEKDLKIEATVTKV